MLSSTTLYLYFSYGIGLILIVKKARKIAGSGRGACFPCGVFMFILFSPGNRVTRGCAGVFMCICMRSFDTKGLGLKPAEARAHA